MGGISGSSWYFEWNYPSSDVNLGNFSSATCSTVATGSSADNAFTLDGARLGEPLVTTAAATHDVDLTLDTDYTPENIYVANPKNVSGISLYRGHSTPTLVSALTNLDYSQGFAHVDVGGFGLDDQWRIRFTATDSGVGIEVPYILVATDAFPVAPLTVSARTTNYRDYSQGLGSSAVGGMIRRQQQRALVQGFTLDGNYDDFDILHRRLVDGVGTFRPVFIVLDDATLDQPPNVNFGIMDAIPPRGSSGGSPRSSMSFEVVEILN